MAGRLSSYRFRRRLCWSAGLLGMLALVVGVSIKIGNTGHSSETAIDYSKPAWVYHEPALLHLTQKDRADLIDTSLKFVRTAVARKHLDSAWDMLAPEMKAGQTRKSWGTGFNNVVPFPADGIQRWQILYAYDNDVAIDLSLVSGKGASWSGKTFTIELKRFKEHPTRWLVASWVPKGIGGGGALSPSRTAGPPLPPVKAKVSTKFLFVPMMFLGFLVLGLLVWAVRGAVHHRRAARKYEDVLGYKSS